MSKWERYVTICKFSCVKLKAHLTEVEAAALNDTVHRKVMGKLKLLSSQETRES